MRSFAELNPMAALHPTLGYPNPKEGGFYRMGNLRIIATWTQGWDHVSVSLLTRCPTWDEMERVKRRFFRDDEFAMQLHVPPSQHVNYHPHCLHLWRPQIQPIPTPDAALVGGAA